MANTLSALIVTLGLDAGEFKKGIDGADKSVGSFAARMQKIGGQMQKLGGQMTVGLTLPIVAFGASSVKSAMEAENAIADLEAVLKSTGGAAGMTLDELTKNAAALQKVTKFSEETTMSAQGMLLTFTNIGKDIFPMATEAALDMAQKFGMDASQAAITLGKALNDPISGVTALRRIGVMLTDEQERQIKSFMDVGDVASAQKIIMNELAVEIGGVARAAGETTSGKFAILMNQFDDMKEQIGAALIPTLINLANAVLPLIEKFSALSPEAQNTIIAIAGIVAAAGPVVTVIGTITSAIGTLTPVFSGLFTFITATAIPAIAAFITANIAWLAPLALIAATLYLVHLAFKNNFGGISTTVKQLAFIIKYYFGQIVNWFKKTFPEATKWLKGVRDKFVEFINKIKDGWKGLSDWISKINPFDAASDGFKGGKPTIKLAVDASEAVAAFEDVSNSAEDLNAKMEAISSRNETFMSSLENYASFDKSYKADHVAAVNAVTEAQNRLNDAVIKYGVDSKQAFEARDSLEAARLGLQELEASWHESTQRMVYDMIQTQLMADGILTDVEAKALVAFGVQSGMFTEEQAKYTQLLIDQANAYVEQTRRSEQLIGTTGSLILMVDKLGQAWMNAANNSALIANSAMRGRGYTAPVTGSKFGDNRALGGSMFAGRPYTVGEHGIETIVPRTNATILPHGEGMGGNAQTINVTVLNPVKETSEESVRKALKNMSYLGVLQ